MKWNEPDPRGPNMTSSNELKQSQSSLSIDIKQHNPNRQIQTVQLLKWIDKWSSEVSTVRGKTKWNTITSGASGEKMKQPHRLRAAGAVLNSVSV